MLRSYPTLDISENGARIIVDCYIPDGLTGFAIIHRPTNIRIDRPSIVVWCKAGRVEAGAIQNFVAGIRFF